MDIGRANEANKSDESGLSKHSFRQPELAVGNPNTTHSSERNTGTDDHSEKHLVLGVDTGRSIPSEAYPGGVESSHFLFNPDVVVSDKRMGPSSSSSSYTSASGSSVDDRFQVNAKVSESRSGIASTSSFKPGDPAFGSLMHDPTLTQSPPVQVMDRIGEYDPYRISSSVFARSKSITAADGSVISNDSLFSIQVEDSSLSRDLALSFKSGEILKSGESFTINPSPDPFAMDPDHKSFEIDKSEANLISDDTLKDETRPSGEEPIGGKATHPTRFLNSTRPSDYSDDTRTSVHSFGFPVLDDGKNVVSKEQKREQQKQQQQQQQRHKQEDQPLAPAVSSKLSCCSNSCSWFDSCQWRWCCCSNSCSWFDSCQWRWCCCSNSCSWFDSCQWRWCCCNWNWNWKWKWKWNCNCNWHWRWCCFNYRWCREKCS